MGTHSSLMRKNYPLAFLIPAGIMLTVFFIAPTIMNFVYAFTDWSAFKNTINFNGFDNFLSLFQNGILMKDIQITLFYAICIAIFQNVFGLFLAVLLEKDTLLNRLARIMFFIPVIMSALAVGYIWQAVLKNSGALDQILSGIFGHSITTGLLANTHTAIITIAFVQGWKWMGLSMLIFLAGLKTIDSDVIEAAYIDGASSGQIFWKIKFPLLAPAFTFNVATSLLGSLNGFDMVQAMTKGGPGGSTEILNIFIWRTFGQGLYAQSTTMSMILFILVALIALPVIYILRRRERNIF